MTLYYIWDAYCGWCYGFGGVLQKFVENHPELELKIISGGLFAGDAPIANYPYMSQVNQQIEEIYHVDFSKAYQELLDEGSLVLDSNHPALAFAILREGLNPSQMLPFAKAMQAKFYQEGQSLSELATYESLVDTFKINPALFEKLKEEWHHLTLAHQDFAVASQFGVSGFPSLILEKDGLFYDLRSGAHSLDDLENHFEILLNS